MIEITCSFNSFRDERRGERAWTYLRLYFGWLLIICGKKGLKVKLPVKRKSQTKTLGRMSFS